MLHHDEARRARVMHWALVVAATVLALIVAAVVAAFVFFLAHPPD